MHSTHQSANKAILRRRLDLQLTEREVAEAAGLSICAYGDVEAYASELYEQISISQARRICVALGMEFLELTLGAAHDFSTAKLLRRHVVIAEARHNAGLTVSALADRIGYEPWVIQNLETSDSYVEEMTLSAVLELAKTLDIKPHILLAAN